MAADGSVVIEAILDASKVTKGIGEVRDGLEGVTWDGIKKGDAAAQRLAGTLKTAGAAATAGLTVPIVAAGTAAFGTASSYEQATARIRSSLGLTADEAERLADVGEGIYENGFGESIDAVDDALVTVRQNLGDLNDADLSYVTTAALTLADTLGMDVGESVRGVGALMDGFGLSARDAMDLFVAGAQDGLDFSGELGDNLAEYGPRFAQMGFSASQYFSILKTGADNGAYSLDKVNDFLNEFQTSLVDGRMDEQIGRFSESTQQLFQSWKDGGATGQQVFEAVMGELARMPDGYEKANVASELWSSLGEDNAMGMITSLAGVEDSFGDVAGAAGEAGDAASDSFASKWESATRTVAGALEPLGDPLLDIATKVAEVVQGFGEWFASIGEEGQTAVLVVAGVLAAIGPVSSILGGILSVVPAIAGALGGLSAAAAPAAAAVGAAGTAGATAAPQLMQMALAVLALGGGVLMASAGLALLALAAVQVAGAGPMAAVAMVGMVAAIAGLAAGAAAVGPALTAGSVGLLAFGGAVALVGVGVLAASAGMALLSGALPGIASGGAAAAAAMALISAGAAVMAAGLVAAGLSVTTFAAGLAVGAVGVAAFALAVGAGALAVSAAALAFGALSLAVGALAAGISTAASGVQVMGTNLPRVASSAAPAAAGLTAFAAAAAAASLGLAAGAPAMAAYGAAAVTAAAGVTTASAGSALLVALLALLVALAVAAAAGLSSLSTSGPSAAAGLASLAASAQAASPALSSSAPALVALAAAALRAGQGSGSAAGALAVAAAAALALAAAVATATTGEASMSAQALLAGSSARSMASDVASLPAPLGQARSAMSSFGSSAQSEASRAAQAVVSACAQMERAVSSMRLRMPRIEVGALPHFTMSGTFDAQTGSVPTIGVSWYAKGAVFNGPSVVGVGEAGPEMALPLNRRSTAPFAEQIAEDMGDGGEVADLLRGLVAALPRMIRENSARSIVWNKREVARLVWKVQ